MFFFFHMIAAPIQLHELLIFFYLGIPASKIGIKCLISTIVVCSVQARGVCVFWLCGLESFALPRPLSPSSSQDAQGAEEREALARMAANVEDAASADSVAYIEKYLRSVLAVENILTLDRLRQVCF